MAVLGMTFTAVGAQATVAPTSAGLLHGISTATSTVLNNAAYWSSAGTKDTFFGWRHKMYFAGRLDQTADTRCWIGLTTATSAAWMASDNPASAHIGFRCSSSAGDAGVWQAVISNGATQTVVSTGIAVSTTVTQNFRIEWGIAATSIKFYINNVLVATISTNLPAAATDLQWTAGVTQLLTAITCKLTMNMLRAVFNGTSP
jgi:hypothetical protein